MKKILIPIGALLISGFAEAQLSTTENYVSSKTYLDYNGTTPTKTSETVQYFDGLGRAKQVVNVKGSPLGRDIVTHIVYDGFGRQVKDYLPVPQGNTLNGAIITDPLANAPNTPLGNEKIYSEKVLENSPLDRIQQQVQVGTDWSTKPVKFDYEANIDGEVKKYVAKFNYTAFESSISFSGFYGAAQLYKNTATDEDGNKTVEFKNGQGQVLLVRKINGTENVDTYYVYNGYNQLAYVIPPLAAASGATDEATLNNLCYQYKYDGRNRLVEKKLPGKGWEYMVYDKQDRLVLTQDANLKEKVQWLFTKYDQFSRPVYTGIFNSNLGRAQQASEVEALGSNNEMRTGVVNNNSGMDFYYTTANAYPKSNFNVLSVSYYDRYPSYSFNPSFPATILEQPVLKDIQDADGLSTKSLPVMSLVKNIEDDNWTKNYTYYDTRGRTVGTYSINHLGGYTRSYSKLDFSGVPQKTETQHIRKVGEQGIVVKERFVYDDQNRLLKHYHQVDSKPEELLAENTYNELSQLSNKKVGNTLQNIDYAYNIRGWMTAINPNQITVPDLGGKLFSYKIKYNQKEGISYPNALFSSKEVKPKYNGNITEVDWRSVENIGNNPSITPKRYGYVYDGLNRLTAGYYQNPNNPSSAENVESLLYDLNGNITTLYRTSVIENMNSITPTKIDNLEYIYDYTNFGNKVKKIYDHADNPTGYEGGGQTITYDLNGNMKTMPDKYISNIDYNFLNLPSKMERGFTLEYKYNAGGIKLQKVNPKMECGIINCYSVLDVTDYLDGFQYFKSTTINNGGGSPEMLSLSSKSARAMEMQAFSLEERRAYPPVAVKTPDLQFFPTAEGFYDYQKDQYIYQYKDHLGNVRVSYTKNTQSQAIEITDVNDYYPFGMNHLKSGTAMFGQSSYKNYKYNGKELQETGMYDYGARMYMADIGRWGVVDPLAEKHTEITPFRYSFNNPVNATDPTGLLEDWIQEGNTFSWDDRVVDQETATKFHEGSKYIGKEAKVASIEKSTGNVLDTTSLNSDGSVTQNGQTITGDSIETRSFSSQAGSTFTPRQTAGSFYGISANFAAIGGFGISFGVVSDSVGDKASYFSFNGNVGLGMGASGDIGVVNPTGSNQFLVSDFEGKGASYSYGISTPLVDVGGGKGGSLDSGYNSNSDYFNSSTWGGNKRGYTTSQAAISKGSGWGGGGMWTYSQTWIKK